MITFKEYLSETPWAAQGDYDEANYLTDFIPVNDFKKYYQKIKDNNKKDKTFVINKINYYLIKSIDEERLYYMLGYYTEDNGDLGFQPIFAITLSKSKIGVKGYFVDNTVTVLEYQKQGIATSVYNYLIDKHHALISGEVQFEPARKLWKKISNSDDIIVDVIDTRDEKIKVMRKDVKITDINDPEIWGRTDRYDSILLVAKRKI